MVDQIFGLFSRAFDFIYWLCSLPVLGDYSILDCGMFGIIAVALCRFLILPIFGKFGSFSSSSAGDRPKTVYANNKTSSKVGYSKKGKK